MSLDRQQARSGFLLKMDQSSNVITDRYGGKRALLHHMAARLRLLANGFREFRAVRWSEVERVVFVCQGNICRSPYAEARARAMGLPTASFGLGAGQQKPADPQAQAAAAARGLDLSGHRSLHLRGFRLEPNDLLVGMEPWQARDLRQLEGAAQGQVTLLGLWSRPPRPHIQDPYGLSRAYFDTCFRTIDAGIATMAQRYEDAGHGRRA